MVDIFFIFYFYYFFLFLTKRKKFPGHDQPLFTDYQCNEDYKCCSQCYKSIEKGSYNYFCTRWNYWWHRNCMPTSSKPVNHPYHPNHALELFVGKAPDYADGKCNFCREEIGKCFYHCSTCNFSLDVRCRYSPEPQRIDESKSHNHPLTLMVRQVSFVCNACGTLGEYNPYLCVACSFMVHVECIDLPYVININRHNHRISHTYSLRPGNKICKVCRMSIDWMYGAYSCTKCPDFVVHSKCATNRHVWDGEELDGVPEEEEDKPMFEMIEENVINHVKHPSHNLRLNDDGVVCDETMRCQLCHGLIYHNKFYSCTECDYILHETCARHPKRTRSVFSTSLLVLKEFVPEAHKADEYYWCLACKEPSTGYMYSDHSGDNTIDLRCAAIGWSCDHECHPHTLFFTTLDRDVCGGCKKREHVLRCVDCKFDLCYKCANYPKKIMHRCDDHPLVLRFGDQEHGTQWCTVCEAKTDPEKWCYECEECGIVCHIQCALGDFTNVKPRLYTTKDGVTKGVVHNNGSTRPHCCYRVCASRSRCLNPFVYISSNKYYCSFYCARWVNESEMYIRSQDPTHNYGL